jgi:hypothetical protein
MPPSRPGEKRFRARPGDAPELAEKTRYSAPFCRTGKESEIFVTPVLQIFGNKKPGQASLSRLKNLNFFSQ